QAQPCCNGATATAACTQRSRGLRELPGISGQGRRGCTGCTGSLLPVSSTRHPGPQEGPTARCTQPCQIPGPARCRQPCQIPGPARCRQPCQSPGPARCMQSCPIPARCTRCCQSPARCTQPCQIPGPARCRQPCQSPGPARCRQPCQSPAPEGRACWAVGLGDLERFSLPEMLWGQNYHGTPHFLQPSWCPLSACPEQGLDPGLREYCHHPSLETLDLLSSPSCWYGRSGTPVLRHFSSEARISSR
uniref:Uncharacterized protein n=1 Tax=Gopherus agassizii TaxID=38772 RepID=A0A452ILE4_9SAUR